MGLRELVHAAGDLQPNADMDYALVIRAKKNGTIEPYSVSLGKILGRSGSHTDFPLKPQDYILVFKADSLPKNLFQKFDLDSLRPGTQGGQQKSRATINQQKGAASKGDMLFLKRSSLIKKEFFHQEGAVDQTVDTSDPTILLNEEERALPKKKMVAVASATPTFLALKTSNRIIETQPKATLERNDLLKPVLAKMREQATSTNPARIVLVTGGVRFPGEYPMERNMRVSDLLRASGKLAEPAYTLNAILTRFEVIRSRYREIDHIPVDLDKILKGDPSADTMLKPHDVLQIRQIPRWGEINRVSLSGKIRFSGIYPIRNGETLAGLIKRAGGLSPLAFPEGAIFLRKSLKERERKEMDALGKRLKMQLAQEESKTQGSARDGYVDTGLLRSLIEKLRSTHPQGRLAIDLPEILASAARKTPYTRIILRDGDSLIVPQQSNEVTVLGEVHYPASHQHKSSLNLEAYINLSGGYSQSADQDKVYVVKANGQVVPRQPGVSMFGSAWFTGANTVPVNPGDTIVIPMEVDKVAPMTYWKDITQIMSNIAITAATLNTIGAL